MSGIKQRRCPEGYGTKSLKILLAAKKHGLHLRADGKIVLPTGKVHEGTPQDGRERITFSVDGERITIAVARVVCFLAYGDPPEITSVADHINGDTLNDHPDNLRWATYSENMLNNYCTREKTQEQRAIEACADIPKPEGIPELVKHYKHIIKVLDSDEMKGVWEILYARGTEYFGPSIDMNGARDALRACGIEAE